MDCRISKLPLSIILWGLLYCSSQARAECDRPVARLVAFQGTVQWARDESGWQDAKLEQPFCRGERFRTLRYTRATIELENRTYISLEQQTSIVFSNLRPDEPSWLDLLKGVLYLRSRTPSSLDIRTPFINAAIKGTEFLVGSSDTEGQVTLFEGRVEASNTQGNLILTDGQTAVAQAGKAPARRLLIKPQEAVQWALYYPPLIDLESLKQSGAPSARSAAALYLAGNVEGALNRLDVRSQAVTRAGLLLGVGRVDEARTMLDQSPTQASNRERADVQALRAVIALAQNQSEQAQAQAELATVTDPASPLGWMALSYVRQAGFQLDKALESAHQAAALAPDNGLIQARIAELSAALGQRRDAQRAADRSVRLNPLLARAWAVKGFAQLSNMNAEEAQTSFQQALRLDANDPLSRFGLGLAKIRRGELEQGTADLEIAASLDPNDSLTRSYLGKAYYEQKRGKLADTEYQLAKQFDPKDPTPWFYDAIKKQTENRPVEALQDMQKAIELNDNRAVVRSRQLLDDDLAIRGASLGRIYDDLGFQYRGLVEAAKSLNFNPANASAHRLLSDSYVRLPRRDIAQLSELLQAQLLQSINITPVQPHLSVKGLSTLRGYEPAETAFKDFTESFARNRPRLTTYGAIGNNDTYADEVVLSGVQDRLSYSLGQFHYQTSGFRKNADVRHDIYDVFTQAALTDRLNLQFEFRHRETEQGNLDLELDKRLTPSDLKRKLNHDMARAGLHLAVSQNSDAIISVAYSDRNESSSDASRGRTKRSTFETLDKTQDNREGFTGEAQYLLREDKFNLVLGGGGYSVDGSLVVDSSGSETLLPDFCKRLGLFPDCTSLNNTPTPKRETTITGHNVYFYSNIKMPVNLNWTIGLSYDHYGDSFAKLDLNELNPKLGLQWDVNEWLRLRTAYFRTVKRLLAVDQTVEPTHVNGFNQLYDDYNGSRTETFGAAFDAVLRRDLFAGFEYVRRDINRPTTGASESGGFTTFSQLREDNYRAYLYWAPYPNWSLSSEFKVERDDTETFDLATKSLPVTLKYFDSRGYFAQVGSTIVWQEQLNISPNDTVAKDSFVVVDAAIGYRLPKRYGIISLEVRNLLDENFAYKDDSFKTSDQFNVNRPYLPDRTILGRLVLSF